MDNRSGGDTFHGGIRDSGSPDDSQLVATGASSAGDAEAIRHLREAITAGRDWFLSLLEAIGLWTSAEEVREGRTCRYLIDGEAFDWLMLAERLCETVDDLIPQEEKDALLFSGIIPGEPDGQEVKKLIGEQKFGHYLNYFYGVTVEEGLLLAVQDEIEKEKRAHGLRGTDASEEAYPRIYDADKESLLREFRREKRYPQLKSTSLTEMKEFTYWLFKYRFKRCEKARIASDTRKSLTYLKRQWDKQGVSKVLAIDLNLQDGE
ncbi:MAG: hypothetical protein MUO19_01850 [Dehalococcoidales bacterium]|nr:hypothetical protein [Dehalococcoidales bacterium]